MDYEDIKNELNESANAFVSSIPKSDKKYAEYSEPDLLIAYNEGAKFAFRLNNWPKDLLDVLLKNWNHLTRGEKRSIVKRVRDLM